jgi:hypothetical protein
MTHVPTGAAERAHTRQVPRLWDADARADRFARDSGFASDPGDPVQGEGEAAELRGAPLDVDIRR